MSNESNIAAEITFDDLVQMVGDDVDTLREIVNSFLDDAPRIMNDIDKGLANEDLALIQLSAHTIKSSSRLFRAENFALLCQQIEDASRRDDFDQVEKAIPELQQNFQIVIGVLAAKLEEL